MYPWLTITDIARTTPILLRYFLMSIFSMLVMVKFNVENQS